MHTHSFKNDDPTVKSEYFEILSKGFRKKKKIKREISETLFRNEKNLSNRQEKGSPEHS